MRTSMRMRSGFTLGAMSTASSPLLAANTSYPAKRKVKATKSRISRSSSAINIFAIDSSLCFVHRQGKGERTSFARNACTFHPDTTFMHIHNLFNDGETQTGSRRCQYQRMLTTVEAFKYAILIFERDAHAIILHVHLHLVPAIQRMDLHQNRSIFGGVMIGVINEITHNLADTFYITIHTREFLRRVERQRHRLVLFLRATQNITNHILRYFAQVDRL